MKYIIYNHFNLSNYISKEEYFSKIFNYVFNRYDEKLITTQLQNQVRLDKEIHQMDQIPEDCIEHVIDFSTELLNAILIMLSSICGCGFLKPQ